MSKSRGLIRTAMATAFTGWLMLGTAFADTPPSVRQDTTRSDYAALDSYIGRWHSDRKTMPDGKRAFRFEYRLAYFDPNKQIVEMKIHQVFEDGDRRLLWHGYKGWNPAEKETFYYGFSPLGRVSTGAFFVSGESLVTAYSAFNEKGRMVEIRDVMSAVNDGTFDSVSYLRPAGETDWRVVGRDQWRRIVKD